jgi:hypothetical protein
MSHVVKLGEPPHPIEGHVIARSRLSILSTAAAVALTAPLLMSGCATAEPADFPAQRTVVADFFDLLESGKTGGIAALLADDSALTSDVLDSDFYAAAVARPTDAEVVAAVESEPGLVYVTVEYSMGGEDRDIKVSVVESGGEPRIEGWLFDTLSVYHPQAPGAFEINGSLQVGGSEESEQVVALPGIYTLEYVDPLGLGTVDPDGKATSSFEVEFPVEREQLTGVVPPGVTSLASSISAEPRLLATVEVDIEHQVDALTAECAASGLVGNSCPSELALDVARRGGADPASVTWTKRATQQSTEPEQWRYSTEFTVAYTSLDGESHGTVNTTFAGAVTADAAGHAVLTLVD